MMESDQRSKRPYPGGEDGFGGKRGRFSRGSQRGGGRRGRGYRGGRGGGQTGQDGEGVMSHGGGFGRGRRGGFGRGFPGRGRGFGHGRNRRMDRSGRRNVHPQKVFADFPEWSADLIYVVLNAVLRLHHITDWLEMSRRVQGPQPDQIKSLWEKLVSELEPPTFQNVLDYTKRLLMKTVDKKKCPKVEGDFRYYEHPCDIFKEKENLLQLTKGQIQRKYGNMLPSEKALYLVAWRAKMKDFDLHCFSYYKDNPEKFQELSDCFLLDSDSPKNETRDENGSNIKMNLKI